MRITGVTFSEGLLFEEAQNVTITNPTPPPPTIVVTQPNHGLTLPASDLIPLSGPKWATAADNARLADPLGATTHLYSPCFAHYGRWELDCVSVTNNNPFPIRFTFAKLPPSTYKDTTNHSVLTRYTGSAPVGADQVDARVQSVMWASLLQSLQTFVTPPEWRMVVEQGESLWGCVYGPTLQATAVGGWPWQGQGGLLSELAVASLLWKVTNLRVTGTIVS